MLFTKIKTNMSDFVLGACLLQKYDKIWHLVAYYSQNITLLKSNYNIYNRPSKTDFAPVRGDGYEPRSSKFRLRANAKTSHNMRYDMVVVVASIVGGGEKFSHRIVRS